MTPVWAFFASSTSAFLFGVIFLVLLWLLNRHALPNGEFNRPRLLAMFALGASTYTFTVLTLSELVLKGPSIAVLVEHGFGGQRIGWLIGAAALDGVLRILEELFAKREAPKAA